MHDQTGDDACFTTRLVVTKCFLQPAFELPEEQSHVGSGRLLEKFDDARTQILPRVINRSEQTDVGP
jgi:hypothetical protein